MNKPEYYRYLVARGMDSEAAVQSIAKQYGRTKPAEIAELRATVGAPPPAASQSTHRED